MKSALAEAPQESCRVPAETNAFPGLGLTRPLSADARMIARLVLELADELEAERSARVAIQERAGRPSDVREGRLRGGETGGWGCLKKFEVVDQDLAALLRDTGEVVEGARLERLAREHAEADAQLGATTTTVQPSPNGTRPGTAGTRFTWHQLSEVEMRSIKFIDKPLLQADAFHLVAGRKGMGKGTLLAEIAARCTRGELDPRAAERRLGRLRGFRLDRHQAADRSGRRRPGACAHPEAPAGFSCRGTSTGSLQQSPRWARSGCSSSTRSVTTSPAEDSNQETDVRDAISPLNKLADDHHCMAFGVRHLSEKECSHGVLAAILGNSAWVQVPRAVLVVARDDDDAGLSHVQCVAGNRLPPDTPGRMFRIEGVLLPGLKNEVTRAVWLGDSSKNVEEMLGRSGGRQASKSDAARDLILDILDPKASKSPTRSTPVIASETGLSPKTVRNLRADLKTRA